MTRAFNQARRALVCAAMLTAALAAAGAQQAHGDIPLVDRCAPRSDPAQGPIFKSANVDVLGSIPGEAGGLDPGGRLVGHYFYVTGSSHFSIYDVEDPVHPKLMSRVEFPCRFENEDVATNGDVLLFTDFATTGSLYVYDVRDKRNPRLSAELAGAGTHTMTCVQGCDFAYGSYHLVSSAGPLRTGEVVDLRDPANPKMLGDWTASGALPSRNVHDVTELTPGIILTASAPIELLDARQDLVSPKVLARSDTPDTKRYHTALWPRAGEDRFMLASFETNGTPNCDLGSGDFSTFDTSGWRTTGMFKLVDSYHLSNSTFVNGNPPANVLGCSPHYFQERPSFHDGGVVALGAYDNGLRFVRVDQQGKISEIGHFVGPGAETSSASWITCDIVYTVDYTRGIDIVRLKDSASDCGSSAGGQAPGSQPGANGGHRVCRSRRHFAIHVRSPRGTRLRRVSVFVHRKRVGVARGRLRARAVVNLRGLPKGRFQVRIVIRTTGGRRIVQHRRYRTCTPKQRGHQSPPR